MKPRRRSVVALVLGETDDPVQQQTATALRQTGPALFGEQARNLVGRRFAVNRPDTFSKREPLRYAYGRSAINSAGRSKLKSLLFTRHSIPAPRRVKPRRRSVVALVLGETDDPVQQRTATALRQTSPALFGEQARNLVGRRFAVNRPDTFSKREPLRYAYGRSAINSAGRSKLKSLLFTRHSIPAPRRVKPRRRSVVALVLGETDDPVQQRTATALRQTSPALFGEQARNLVGRRFAVNRPAHLA